MNNGNKNKSYPIRHSYTYAKVIFKTTCRYCPSRCRFVQNHLEFICAT